MPNIQTDSHSLYRGHTQSYLINSQSGTQGRKAEAGVPLLDNDAAEAQTWVHSIGFTGLTTSVGGTICSLVALAFLYFLWLGNATNYVWQELVLAGWVTRSITITSLALRIVVSAQAVVCTSMLAAMLLQRVGITLPNFAAVSLARLNVSGPLDLAWVLFARERVRKGVDLLILLIIILLTTTSTQFTSTILLSGIEIGAIEGASEASIMSYGVSFDPRTYYYQSPETADHYTQMFWKTKPSVYPSFAEYSEAPVAVDGVHDTGKSFRALLPINSVSQREALKQYKGKATLLDSRVVCARPQLENLSFRTFGSMLAFKAPVVRGLVGTNLTAPGLGIFCEQSCRESILKLAEDYDRESLQFPEFTDPAQPLLPFKCSSAIYGPTNMAMGVDTETPIALCSVGSWTGLLSPFWNTSKLLYQPDADNLWGGWYDYKKNTWKELGTRQAYLVIQTSGALASWEELSSAAAYADLELEEPMAAEEWLTYPVKSHQSNVSISFSLCFVNFGTLDLTIEATRESNHSEPMVEWLTHGKTYNTTALRHQLGAVARRSTTSDRSTFHMNEPSLSNHLKASVMLLEQDLAGGLDNVTDLQAMRRLTDPVTFLRARGHQNFSVIMCQYCDSGDYGPPEGTTDAQDDTVANINFTYPHPVYASIFNDVMRDTNHPALALQAHFTVLYQTAYYDLNDRFDVFHNTTTISFVGALRPANLTVLLIVTAIIGLHLIVTVIIALSFIQGDALSLLGNAWSCIAQVHVGEAAPWLEIAKSKSDKEIEMLMREYGEHKTRVQLSSGT